MPEQISVAVIGAGMAGRSHAAAYRMANSVSGEGLPPIRLAAIADANVGHKSYTVWIRWRRWW